MLFILLHALSATAQSGKFETAIEDNSFFIEEAYNQEDHVVQHINSFLFSKTSYNYNFTQEWPIAGLKHQLSYSIPLTHIKNGATGIGDAMINYRYQLLYKENAVVAAPRLSLILPTGDKARGLGTGSWGAEFNLPVSKRWNNKFINHFNAGVTHLSKLKDEELHFDRSVTSYFGGLSSIWLARQNFNIMLEYIFREEATPSLNSKIGYNPKHMIAPGARFAFEMKELQIVPGVTVPLTFEKAVVQPAFLFYISFEHPY